jgi:hypothetical protein
MNLFSTDTGEAMVTDEDLLRAWQHSDAGALGTLVQRYQRKDRLEGR